MDVTETVKNKLANSPNPVRPKDEFSLQPIPELHLSMGDEELLYNDSSLFTPNSELKSSHESIHEKSEKEESKDTLNVTTLNTYQESIPKPKETRKSKIKRVSKKDDKGSLKFL